MKTTRLAVLAAVAMCVPAGAVSISLFDYGVNVDGDARFPFDGDLLQAGVDAAGFDPLTGLGTLSVSITGDGAHFVGLFVDHEIDEAINTFFNEVGSVSGSPGPGQSFEIDEPGFAGGDIVTNFIGSSLDGLVVSPPEDISMAMGWDFSLLGGETAEIDFVLGDTAPASGFYLEHFDPRSDASVFFSSTNTIRGGHGVPDGGGSLVLLLCGLAGLGVALKWRGAERPS